MEKQIKLIVFDLDGTVLDHGKEISDTTLEAFTRAHESGCVLAAATGRGLDIIPPEIMNHPGVGYIIGANGAVIMQRADKKILSVRGMEHEVVVDLIKAARGYGAGIELFYTDRSCYELRCIGMMMRHRYGKYKVENNSAWREMNTFFEFVKNIKVIFSAKTIVNRKKEPIVKIAAIFKKPDAFARAFNEFGADERVEAATTMGMDIEITARDVTKGRAISMLCHILRIEREAVMAFGDSGNDLSMREHAGTFVAMGNAGDKVKAVADRVAPDVSDNGVARVLHEIFRW
jgi:HAD-superfamily hydrolase, subfamily IIB